MRFPILYSGGYAKICLRQNPQWPADIPWEMAVQYRDRIQERCGMALERLAKHGGLAPKDLVMVIEGAGPELQYQITLEQAMARLIDAVKQFEYSRAMQAVEAEDAARTDD